ncbi:MAG: excinuclease ABC subunit UvrC [bacterium]
MSSIKKKIKLLPDRPGVYLFKDKKGEIIYVGKAGSLRRRVASYFMRAGDVKTEKLVSEIFDLEIRETPSAIEALILESQLIKKLSPKYNIKEKDDRSFLYIGITGEKFPKPILIRGSELQATSYKLQANFGPFTSAGALREALKILRGIFPWSECSPAEVFGATKPKRSGGFSAVREAGKENQGRPCFYYGIKKCPGVCVGKISKKEYAKNIKNLILFLSGRRDAVIRNLNKEMRGAAKAQDFERAAELRNHLYALNHIRDISLIKKEDYKIHPNPPFIKEGAPPFGKGRLGGIYNAMGRIEGYDISNISGAHAVGGLVVFESGEPKKSEYKKFKIRTIKGANDVGMLCEVLSRRFKHSEWPRPDIIFIDGGEGQVNAAKSVLQNFKLKIPVIGIAKGLSRKNDRFVYDTNDLELERVVKNCGDLFKRVRDEAHRFAIKYHRNVRAGFFKK